MLFRILAVSLLLYSTISFAQGRKPAVEDFVGIEIDHPEGTPQGTEGLFNLEKDIGNLQRNSKVKAAAKQTPASLATTTKPWNAKNYFALSFILGLPLLCWVLVLSHLRRKATQENASNIAVLENYRQKREAARKTAAQAEDRKVS